ncbi:MAG: signal recognition particle-docking protein FtsY [Halanaerobiales bacterium]
MSIFKNVDNNQDQDKGMFEKLKDGLTKTKKGVFGKLNDLFSKGKELDEEFFTELEELLIQADIGVHTTIKMIEDLKLKVEKEDIEDSEEFYKIFKKELSDFLQAEKGGLTLKEGLNVIMVVGVNGSGKTTTIAKIASKFKKQGKEVMVAACDTFRAAAIDQLEVWTNKLGVRLIAQKEGSDAAAVAYDAIQSARAKNSDVLIVDTAGRLHTQKNLMEELKKVKRVIYQEAEEAHKQILLVLDATNGQNAISQAKLFHEAVNIDGIALTKLDGTAKGGVVVAVKNEVGIPIKLIGVGEQEDDLQVFKPDKFVEALFS